MKRLGIITATALAGALGLSIAPAFAAPPTTRTVDDRVDAGAAYDIVSVTLSAAPAGRKAKVVIAHGRRVEVGDSVDVWIDTDDDRLPNLHIAGLSFSEYGVYKTNDWDRRGRDITDRGCASLKMVGKKSVIRFDPSCLAPSARFSVSVRSSVQGEPAASDDYVPRQQRLTKKVLSYEPGQ